MLCKIADLIAEVPTAGGLAPRCEAYLWKTASPPEIIIREEDYRAERYDPRLGFATVAYMEAAYQFYLQLVEHGGFYLHSSAVMLDGKVYLFSGPCRIFQRDRDPERGLLYPFFFSLFFKNSKKTLDTDLFLCYFYVTLNQAGAPDEK